MLKFTLVAMFVAVMATFTLAASALPVPTDTIVAEISAS